MAKYNELLAVWKPEIEKIKKWQAQADELLAKMRMLENEPVDYETSDDPQKDHENYMIFSAHQQHAIEQIYNQWREIDENICIEKERISQDLDAEYAEVPFSKPRQQGISKFWELAGI